MNRITFDIAPGVNENIPSHRVTTMLVADERIDNGPNLRPTPSLMETIQALQMLNKNVLSIDIAPQD